MTKEERSKHTIHLGINFTVEEYEMIDKLLRHYGFYNKAQLFRIILKKHYNDVIVNKANT